MPKVFEWRVKYLYLRDVIEQIKWFHSSAIWHPLAFALSMSLHLVSQLPPMHLPSGDEKWKHQQFFCSLFSTGGMVGPPCARHLSPEEKNSLSRVLA